MSGRKLTQAALAATAAMIAAPASAATLYAANGHYYEFVPTVLAWDAALAAAETHTAIAGYDSYLVTITDAGEDAFVRALIGSAVYVWAAGTDSATEGTWKWAAGPELGQTFFIKDGPVVGYSNWNAGEPNNSGTENALHLHANGGEWNDVPNGFSGGGYVVEYSAAAVPEPATWALMIGGFGLMGATLRRRRTVGAATA